MPHWSYLDTSSLSVKPFSFMGEREREKERVRETKRESSPWESKIVLFP